jgi:hypothetical protein
VPAPSDDPVVQLAELGARLWSEVEHVRVMAQLTVRGPLMHEVGTALAPLREFLLETVRRGVAEGRMRDDVPVETLAHLVEGSALAVLDEATVRDLDRAEGHRLVMLAVLGMVGLGWREAGELIRSTPALALASPTSSDDGRSSPDTGTGSPGQAHGTGTDTDTPDTPDSTSTDTGPARRTQEDRS